MGMYQSILKEYIKIKINGTICGKGEEVVWWMESHGMFSRVLNVLPREKLKVPQGIFYSWTRGQVQGQTKGQKAFGLAEDVAQGSPLENPKGGLQYSSEGVHWVLKGPPKGSIHHDTSEAFPQMFILFT